MSENTEQQSVIHVRNTLKRLGAQGEVRRLDDSARTAKEAADALGIEVGQIASSLIFLADAKPVLVIASGKHRVNTNSIAAILAVNEVTKATADDVRQATGFAIGGVAPVGHPEPLPTIIDISLSRYDQVWAAGGHPHYVFPTSYDELLRITAGEAAVMSVTCLDLARSHGTSRLRVRDVPLADAPRQRLAEMGVRPGAEVSVVQRTSGGGVVVEVGGAHIALDRATARAITVEGS